MFRNMKNIMFLLILCFIASGVPLYADTVDIRLPSFPTRASAGELLAFSGQAQQIDTETWQISGMLQAMEEATTIPLNAEQLFSAQLYLGETLIQSIDLQEALASLDQLEALAIEPGQPFQFEFELDQKELNVPAGSYRLQLEPHFDNTDNVLDPYVQTITYENGGTYVPALNSINRNQTALTLYFPNQDYSHLVPITRVIPYTNRPLRNTLDQLVLGPNAELGLSEGAPVPTSTGINLAQKIAHLYLPEDMGNYNSNSTDAAMAMESYTMSLTSIAEVEGVQFYFDNQILETQFHGAAVDEPLYRPTGGTLYGLTLTDTQRLLLVPLEYTINTVEAMFEHMKYSNNPTQYSYSIQPVLTEEADLLGYELIDGVLTLNLTANTFDSVPDNKKLAVVEALVYSFTSLDNVDSLLVQLEGQLMDNIDPLNLQEPLIPSAYINPELMQ